MLNHSFTWNGHSSDEFGIKIERFRALNRSARKFDAASVPGRNGNIYGLQNAWEEVLVSYEIWAQGIQTANMLDMTQSSGIVTGTPNGYIINGTQTGDIEQITLYNRTESQPVGYYHINGIGNIHNHNVQMLYVIETDQGMPYQNGRVPDDGMDIVLPYGYYMYMSLDVLPDTYNNVFAPCFMGGQYDRGLEAKWTNIMEWLNSADGYAELSDTYDTQHYREAVFVEATDIANSWNKFGRAVVSFRCRPERFLSGYKNMTVSFTNGQAVINNPTNHIAKPMISDVSIFSGSDNSISINDIKLDFTFGSVYPLDPAVIDCEDENVYTTGGQNLNPYVSITDAGSATAQFLYLKSGQNTIVSDRNSITLNARFWEL